MLAALLAAAVLPYFIGLGDSAIWDANEAFYVETPREMIERGDYVSPTFNYEPRFNKPVLSYWIVGGFYQAFGVSVGVQRLADRAGRAGLIVTAVARWLAMSGPTGRAARGVDARALGDDRAGRGAAAADAGAAHVHRHLHLAVHGADAARASPRRSAIPHVAVCFSLMYVSVGLGMLTKGPVAAVVPGLVFAAYLLVHRELRRVRMMIPAGIAHRAGIVVPWYAALYAPRRLDLHRVLLRRREPRSVRVGSSGVQVQRGPLFYLPVALQRFVSLGAVPGAGSSSPGGASAARGRPSVMPAGRVRTLLWLWIAVFVGFFSFSAGKQDLYIFPIVPAVAALAGWATGARESGPRTASPSTSARPRSSASCC